MCFQHPAYYSFCFMLPGAQYHLLISFLPPRVIFLPRFSTGILSLILFPGFRNPVLYKIRISYSGMGGPVNASSSFDPYSQNSFQLRIRKTVCLLF